MKRLTFLFILGFSLQSCKSTSEQPNKPERENVFVTYEEPPKYPGGNEACFKFIEENIKYPAEAIAQKLEGRVIVQFIIDRDGSVIEPKVYRGVNPLLDQEAIRVVGSMPKWIPGKFKYELIRCKMVIPVTFSLKD